jgi:hypothetical protein
MTTEILSVLLQILQIINLFTPTITSHNNLDRNACFRFHGKRESDESISNATIYSNKHKSLVSSIITIKHNKHSARKTQWKTKEDELK